VKHIIANIIGKTLRIFSLLTIAMAAHFIIEAIVVPYYLPYERMSSVFCAISLGFAAVSYIMRYLAWLLLKM
jgi:hypothetical protein